MTLLLFWANQPYTAWTNLWHRICDIAACDVAHTWSVSVKNFVFWDNMPEPIAASSQSFTSDSWRSCKPEHDEFPQSHSLPYIARQFDRVQGSCHPFNCRSNDGPHHRPWNPNQLLASIYLKSSIKLHITQLHHIYVPNSLCATSPVPHIWCYITMRAIQYNHNNSIQLASNCTTQILWLIICETIYCATPQCGLCNQNCGTRWKTIVGFGPVNEESFVLDETAFDFEI